MRLYRNHYHGEGGSSYGFEWFASKHDAEQAARQHDSQDEEEGIFSREDDKTNPVAEPFDFEPTKKGILELLGKVATHNDNG